MPRVLCTALNTDEGPHFRVFQDAGWICEVVDRSLNLWDSTTLANVVTGFDAVLAGSEPYTAEVLAANPQLRVLSRYGVGFDAINLAECDTRRIVVATTPGCNHHSVAEHAIALLMGVARGFPRCDQEVRNSVWSRVSRPRVMGSTLGLVGLGRIGQAVATRGLGLGMSVVAYDPLPPSEFVEKHGIELLSLTDLLNRADYVSLHLPVLPSTKQMINADSIEKMKDGAVLINTSRGPLVDEAALIQALRTGKLRAAGLDVFETEPLPVTSPLLQMDNVLLSGHVAGLDDESHNATCLMAAETILLLYQGAWPSDRIQNLRGIADWSWQPVKS